MDWNVIQYMGWIVGIISSGYAIYLRRKLFRLQSKAEKARAKSYHAKAKAEEAREAEHATKTVNNILDWFRSKKQGQSDDTSGYA